MLVVFTWSQREAIMAVEPSEGMTEMNKTLLDGRHLSFTLYIPKFQVFPSYGGSTYIMGGIIALIWSLVSLYLFQLRDISLFSQLHIHWVKCETTNPALPTSSCFGITLLLVAYWYVIRLYIFDNSSVRSLSNLAHRLDSEWSVLLALPSLIFHPQILSVIPL